MESRKPFDGVQECIPQNEFKLNDDGTVSENETKTAIEPDVIMTELYAKREMYDSQGNKIEFFLHDSIHDSDAYYYCLKTKDKAVPKMLPMTATSTSNIVWTHNMDATQLRLEELRYFMKEAEKLMDFSVNEDMLRAMGIID